MKLLTFIECNGKEIAVPNCTRWRSDLCDSRCTIFGKVSRERCESCSIRVPVVRLHRNRLRGLGDLVHLAIKAAFLGRTDIAERIAERASRLVGMAPRQDRQPPQDQTQQQDSQQERKGCGCKARQAKLNALLPFGK